MQNRWTVDDEPLIGWVARLPRIRRRELLELGAETGAYRVGAAPCPGEQDPEALLPAASARIAHADATGAIVEADVADLGAVLAAAPHHAPEVHRAPLRLSVARAADPAEFELLVGSCSDIWLPWCSARFEPDAHADDLADNRVLAARNASRLNAFVRGVRELAERDGGEFAVDRDATATRYGFQIDDRGVLLDVPNPMTRAVPERFGGWDEPELPDALRQAARRLARRPPPPPFRGAVRAYTHNTGHRLYRAGRADVLRALRDPEPPGAPLRRAELAGVAEVQVENGQQRFVLDVAEFAD